MYSDWFCLIGVEYIDINGKMIDKFILTDIISYVKIINREYMSRYYFTIFGQLNHTFYGDPDENLLREAFEKIACKFPSIEIKYKLGLLILSITILIIIYLSPYFQISNKLEVRIINLENKIENIEDLIKIKHDIKILKNKVNTK